MASFRARTLEMETWVSLGNIPRAEEILSALLQNVIPPSKFPPTLKHPRQMVKEVAERSKHPRRTLHFGNV